MSWVAVGIGAASLVGGMISSSNAAEAQGNIAGAQLREQRATREAATRAAAASPQEIAALEQANQLNNQDIQRKQKLIDSSDPALLEAGNQALQLLQGKSSAALNPLKSTQAAQRKQLEDKLRAQLGPGYANTTAGIQALAAFDQSAFNSQSNAQQTSLAQLLGVAQNTSAQYGMQTNVANASNISAAYGNQSNRMVSAINGTPITAAGSEYAGALAGAQQQQAMFQGIGSLASMYGGYQMSQNKNPNTQTVNNPFNGNGPQASYGNN